jgi:hypothetical protein
LGDLRQRIYCVHVAPETSIRVALWLPCPCAEGGNLQGTASNQHSFKDIRSKVGMQPAGTPLPPALPPWPQPLQYHARAHDQDALLQSGARDACGSAWRLVGPSKPRCKCWHLSSQVPRCRSKGGARSREGFDCFGKISGRADREPPGCPSQRRKSTTVFENQRKSISNIKKYTKINEFHKKYMNIEPRRVLARPWRAPAVPSERM